MPQGKLVLFNHAAELIGKGVLGDPTTLSYKLALVSVMPVVTAADPRWGDAGITDLSANEVSGTDYTAGGDECANPTFVRVAGEATFDLDDPAGWPKAALGEPTPVNGIMAGVLYVSSGAQNWALGFIDMTHDDGVTATSLAIASIPVQLPSIYALTVNAA